MRPRDLFALGLRLSAALIVATVLALAGCDEGSNGGLDGDDDDPTPELPVLIQYGSSSELHVEFAPSDTMHVHYDLSGRWAPAADSMTVQGGMAADSGPERFGAFQLGISAQLIRVRGSHPITGAWAQQSGPSGLQTTVVADAGGAGAPGVSVTYIESGLMSGDTTLVWADLVDPGASAPDWIEWAATGYLTLALAAGHVALGASDLAVALGHDGELVAAGAAGLSVTGEPFPGTGAAGTAIYRWLDMNSSGNVNPMDAFTFARAGWWIAGPGSDEGTLLDGEWSLRDYIENRDPVIAVGGVLDFADLNWRRARKEGATWLVDDPGLAVTGTGHLFLQEVR